MKQIGVSIPEETDEIMDEVARVTGIQRSALNRFAVEEFAQAHRFIQHDPFKATFLQRAVKK